MEFRDQYLCAPRQWTSPAINSVRVTAHYPGAYTFARILRWHRRNGERARDRSHWIREHNGLSEAVGGQLSDAPRRAVSAGRHEEYDYNLTPQDITTLSGMSSPANQVTLLNGTNNQLTPGNIAQVQMSTPWNGNAAYKDAIDRLLRNMSKSAQERSSWRSRGAGRANCESLQNLCGVNGNPQNIRVTGCQGQARDLGSE